jgi:glycosyltransferase involved in cell wall biosynthesis
MNICMTGHVYPLPPTKYAGVERVTSWWINELKRRGHQVTLVGHKDSTIPIDRLIVDAGGTGAPDAFVDGISAARQLGCEVTHDNNDCHHPNPHRWDGPYIYTVHACVWNGNPNPVFLSYHQAKWHKYPGFPTVVHNGFPLNEYPMGKTKEPFALWLASLRTCKAPELAIEACVQAGVPLKIVGPIQDSRYAEYPRLYPKGGKVEYLGEMGAERLDLFRRASCFIYTCDDHWMEGFNLTNVEAMLSGTPVIALRTANNRIADEQIVHGASGAICDSVKDMVPWIKQAVSVGRFHPEVVRACGARFSIANAVDRYLEAYESAIRGKKW